MALPVVIYVPIVVIGIIVIVFLIGARGRGKLIECPECGAQFKRPAFVEKAGGIGFSLPGIGDFTCPKCNYRGNTSNFRYVGKDEEKTESGSGNVS